MDKRLRLGFIYPAGGGDQEYYSFADSVDEELMIVMLSTRLWGNDQDHDIECLLKSGGLEQLASAAAKFETLDVASVMWACTSASFVGGVAWAKDQARVIAEASGAPASGTSLAICDALNALAVKRVAIMATYPPVVAERLRQFLSDEGFETVGMHSLDIISGWDAAQIPMEQLKQHICAADTPNAQAIVVPDTAVATLPIIDELESDLGKPVISANQATLWKGLRLADSSISPVGSGALWSF